MPLSAAEHRARFDFVRELRELRAAAHYALAQGDSLSRLIAEARAESDGSGDENVTTQTDSVNARLSRALERGRRHRTALENWFNGLMGVFVGGPTSQGSMTGPTESQQRQITTLRSRIEEMIATLDAVATADLPPLNAALQEAGRSAIRVPARRSLDPEYPDVCRRSTATNS
jgi:hypothetical protein